METIEYRTVDMTSWPRGPWDTEPDKRQWRDGQTGLPCLIVRQREMGHLCGYVGVPEGHPAYGKDYDSVDAEVHGGLTFAQGCSDGPESSAICHLPSPGESDKIWWLGFDAAHAGDISPALTFTFMPSYFSEQEYRTFDYMTEQCRLLARQLKAMEAVHE